MNSLPGPAAPCIHDIIACMPWPPEIQEAEDRMNEAKAELLAYIESKEPRDRNKHRGLAAKMEGTIREFEKRVAQFLKNQK